MGVNDELPERYQGENLPESDDTIVVIGSARSQHYHRMSPRADESNPNPACNKVRMREFAWRTKPYGFIKGWRMPCSRPRCYGERDD